MIVRPPYEIEDGASGRSEALRGEAWHGIASVTGRRGVETARRRGRQSRGRSGAEQSSA